MSFHIETRTGKAGERTGAVYVLTNDHVRAEVWPFAGFNCLRWQVRADSGSWGDLFYVAPDWETNPVPTRSGHPVLFPFPNRLKAGRLQTAHQTYRLPLNDSTQANAIHGFAPRVPWRVLDTQAGATEATITGQFRLSVDDPASRDLWPADCILNLTYRLSSSSLQVDAVVENPGPARLPFGIGYHPYFRLPADPDSLVDAWELQSTAATLWPLRDSLPTGEEVPAPPELDFQTRRKIGPLSLDHLYGGLAHVPMRPDGWRAVAQLRSPGRQAALTVEADATFEKLILFTPVHRKAVAIEPYSCITDAAHLQEQVPNTGWRELLPGQQFTASVRYRWSQDDVS
ncbi:MAG: aldose 1-epimerase [Bacteroidales bacterium]|nr:aldose 1-epimerase [Bacteroidales bacterium]